MAQASTIIYVGCRPDDGIERRRLAGMRRYAAALGWRVETLEHADCSRAALKKAIRMLRPIGCVAECWNSKTTFPPSVYGDIPVVYFGAPEKSGWQGALRVESDDAAVARLAFKELSAGKPSAYTVVSFWKARRWQRERIDAFRECCREAGFDCPFAYFPEDAAPRNTVPTQSLVEWAASLPKRCAVFAVNDGCAYIVADALARAGRELPRTVTLVGVDGAEPWLPVDREIAPMVSSVVLDHEFAGYLAAKMLGEKTNPVNPVNPVKENSAFSATPRETLVFPPLLVDRRKSTRGYGRREPHVLEAMERIRREACDGLTVTNLAKRFPGTRRLFEVRFREAAGHSALDEILNVRLARAVELLANTDTSIAAVADSCGFERMGSFWKTFRKRIGVSPQAFRDARR